MGSGDVIAYGARCQWWDDKRKAGSKDGTPTGLPCCPQCGGMLFEIDDAKWYESIRRHQERRSPGYVAFMDWVRGKCFPTPGAATFAYRVATGRR